MHGGKPTILTDRHAGVDPEAVRNSLQEEPSRREIARLKRLHGDRVVMAGVEKVEKIKGVWLKMLAFEDMLLRYPHLVGRQVSFAHSFVCSLLAYFFFLFGSPIVSCRVLSCEWMDGIFLYMR